MATYGPDESNIFIAGTKVNNYEEDATGGTLWTSTTTFQATVPTGKRWLLVGGTIYRTQNATYVCDMYDSADKVILRLGSGAAATGRNGFPTDGADTAKKGYQAIPIIMDAGEYVKMSFGAAQDASASCSCVVYEFDV